VKALSKKPKKHSKATRKQPAGGDIEDIIGILGKRKVHGTEDGLNEKENQLDNHSAEPLDASAEGAASQGDILSATDTVGTSTSQSIVGVEVEDSRDNFIANCAADHGKVRTRAVFHYVTLVVTSCPVTLCSQ
jgi:hypothetical protein